jgi:hypothetical protein
MNELANLDLGTSQTPKKGDEGWTKWGQQTIFTKLDPASLKQKEKELDHPRFSSSTSESMNMVADMEGDKQNLCKSIVDAMNFMATYGITWEAYETAYVKKMKPTNRALKI